MSTIFASKLEEIFRDPWFVDLVVDALDAAIGERGASPSDDLRDKAFSEMVARVTGVLAVHPKRALLSQFLASQSRLSDAEVIQLFEFVYSFLVNQFKGELAESLSWPTLVQFLSTLVAAKRVPAGAEIIAGAHIRAPRGRAGAGRNGWYKSIDALLLARQDSVRMLGDVVMPPDCETPAIIVGAAEIKSHRENVGRALAQIESNLVRLSFGARVRDLEFTSGEALLLAARRSEKYVCSVLPQRQRRSGFARLVIQPRRGRGKSWGLQQVRHRGSDWAAELPVTTQELSWAAYQMTDWFIGEMGSLLFAAVLPDGLPQASSLVRNPWPEMKGSEAGRNAFRAAMYEAGMRPALRGPDPSLRSAQRAIQTFHWLYNAVCFGHGRATGVRILFPEHLRKPDARPRSGAQVTPRRSGDDILRVIHRAYAREHLQIARRLLESEGSRDASLQRKRRYLWLMAMIAYRECRFTDALKYFPGADGATRDYWWTRDQLMMARLLARNGDGPGARDCLQHFEPLDSWPYGALPVEYWAVSGLAWLGDHRNREAARSIDNCLKALAQLRLRQDTGDLDNVHPGTVFMAILDLASCLVALGRERAAVEEIKQLSGVAPWIVEYVRRDPRLTAIQDRLQHEWSSWH